MKSKIIPQDAEVLAELTPDELFQIAAGTASDELKYRAVSIIKKNAQEKENS